MFHERTCHREINTTDIKLGSGRTGLTKFVWPFQKSRQNLSLPNFQFVKRGRTETQQNIVSHKCQSHGNKQHRLALFAGKVRSHGLMVIR